MDGSGPTTRTPAPQPILTTFTERNSWVRQTGQRLTLAQKVGQLFVPSVTGAGSAASDPDNLARFGVPSPEQAVVSSHLGGVVYFGWAGNIVSPGQLALLGNGLRRAAGREVPLMIAVDQETGQVARLGSPVTEFPGAMALAATRDPENTRQAYAIVGRELRALGINTALAPVADVNVDPANPVIGVRAFSSDPGVVSAHVAAAIGGLHQSRMLAVAKHFPGHGDTDVDSHRSLPVIRHSLQRWVTSDAPPFQTAISAGVDAIMTAHISVPELDAAGDPATLSSPVLTGLLRERLGFSGVIMTDSLRMAGVRARYADTEIAIRAIEAGADLLLDPPLPAVQYQAVVDAVLSGRLPERRIEQSLTRILRMKYGLLEDSEVEQADISRIIGTVDHRALAQQITDRTTTLLVNDGGLVPIRAGSVLVTGCGDREVTVLAAKLRSAGRTATGFATGARPPVETIAAAVGRAQLHDIIVVTTVTVRDDSGQRDLVTALSGTNKPLIVVALGDPYDIAYLGNVPSYLATYSSTDVALDALARVLLGRLTPEGRLPVGIPVSPYSAAIGYPIGSGLGFCSCL